MKELKVARRSVLTGSAEDFEAEERAKVGGGIDGSDHSILLRREPVESSLFPAPDPAHTEYVEVSWAGLDGDMGAENEDVFEEGSTVGISRAHHWTRGGILHFTLVRLTVAADRAEEFEVEVRRQVGLVLEREPGTVLYSFSRRTRAGLLGGPAGDQAEYLNLMAYVSAADWELHQQYEHATEGWAWGPTFKKFLVAPPQVERVHGESVIVGATREQTWGDLVVPVAEPQ